MRGPLLAALPALATAAALAVAAPHGSALAEEEEGFSFLGLDLKGSLGEGRHSRYVPPLTNPIFNETPYITTEIRPFYFYHGGQAMSHVFGGVGSGLRGRLSKGKVDDGVDTLQEHAGLSADDSNVALERLVRLFSQFFSDHFGVADNGVEGGTQVMFLVLRHR